MEPAPPKRRARGRDIAIWWVVGVLIGLVPFAIVVALILIGKTTMEMMP